MKCGENEILSFRYTANTPGGVKRSEMRLEQLFFHVGSVGVNCNKHEMFDFAFLTT